MRCPFCYECADYDGDFYCGTRVARDGSYLRSVVCRLGERVRNLEDDYSERLTRVAK